MQCHPKTEKPCEYDGEQYPLGVWVPDWPAAKVTSAIMEILVMERLGYNISKGEGAGTPTNSCHDRMHHSYRCG